MKIIVAGRSVLLKVFCRYTFGSGDSQLGHNCGRRTSMLLKWKRKGGSEKKERRISMPRKGNGEEEPRGEAEDQFAEVGEAEGGRQRGEGRDQFAVKEVKGRQREGRRSTNMSVKGKGREGTRGEAEDEFAEGVEEGREREVSAEDPYVCEWEERGGGGDRRSRTNLPKKEKRKGGIERVIEDQNVHERKEEEGRGREERECFAGKKKK